jgi:AMMECR1 domain-containing protein
VNKCAGKLVEGPVVAARSRFQPTQELEMMHVRTLCVVIAVALAGGVAAADAPKKTAPTAPAKDATPAKDAPKDAAKDAPKDAKAKPLTEQEQKDIKTFLAFFDKLVDVVVGAKEDCDKIATGVNGLVDKSKDVIALAAKAKASGMQLPKDAQDHMMASMQKMMPAMQKCSTNDKVKAAFGRLDGK